MKVKAKQVKVEPEFTPVEVSITLESKREVQAFYTLFNTAAICTFLAQYEINHNTVRAEVASLSDRLHINELHMQLQDILKKAYGK